MNGLDRIFDYEDGLTFNALEKMGKRLNQFTAKDMSPKT